MKLSQCFAGSNGDLSCFSCHEIHNQPGARRTRGALSLEVPGMPRERGLRTRTEPSTGKRLRELPYAQAGRGRDLPLVPDESPDRAPIRSTFPDAAFSLTTIDLPELVHVNRPPGAGGESLPLLVRFKRSASC